MCPTGSSVALSLYKNSAEEPNVSWGKKGGRLCVYIHAPFASETCIDNCQLCKNNKTEKKQEKKSDLKDLFVAEKSAANMHVSTELNGFNSGLHISSYLMFCFIFQRHMIQN